MRMAPKVFLFGKAGQQASRINVQLQGGRRFYIKTIQQPKRRMLKLSSKGRGGVIQRGQCLYLDAFPFSFHGYDCLTPINHAIIPRPSKTIFENLKMKSPRASNSLLSGGSKGPKKPHKYGWQSKMGERLKRVPRE